MENTGVCLILSLKSFCRFSMKIYAPVSSKNFSKIINPLDLIYGNAYKENDVNSMGDERPTEGSIYDIKFVYNPQLVGYTTSMSHMDELGDIFLKYLIL